MKRSIPLLLVGLFALAFVACGKRESTPAPGSSADTARAGTSDGAKGGPGAASSEEATTVEGTATTASDVSATGAPSPPGGYAVESRPAAGGQLAVIEYASPKTVAEVASYYDGQIQAARRVELDVAGDNIVAYGLTPSTTIGPATTPQDVERLLDQRSEPVVVVGPWKMQRNDPLIHDLREAGQDGQADALLNTKSKVTVIYAVH